MLEMRERDRKGSMSRTFLAASQVSRQVGHHCVQKRVTLITRGFFSPLDIGALHSTIISTTRCFTTAFQECEREHENQELNLMYSYTEKQVPRFCGASMGLPPR